MPWARVAPAAIGVEGAEAALAALHTSLAIESLRSYDSH